MISGVTSNDDALALVQEKFTNWPGAAKAGETVKLDTAGERSVLPPPVAPPVLALCVAELFEAPRANPEVTNKDSSNTKLKGMRIFAI